MEDKLEIRNGYWWPKYDYGCWNFLLKRADLPQQLSSYVREKKVVVQAGGNAGLYTKMYSSLFERVYAFEPEYLNFQCLVRNTGTNVVKFQACLGNEKKFVSLTETVEYFKDRKRKKFNSGSHRVSGPGIIPVMRLDDFDLDGCDLIHLDVEGYEAMALLGAESTIKKYHPVIVVELTGHGEKFGWSDQKITELIESWGYRKNNQIFEDVVFLAENDRV